MQLWIQHKKLQRNGGKRHDLLVLAMANLEVQGMILGLFLEMMDMGTSTNFLEAETVPQHFVICCLEKWKGVEHPHEQKVGG